MVSVSTSVTVNASALETFLTGPRGPVYKMLTTLGKDMVKAAQDLAPTDTKRLKRDITYEVTRVGARRLVLKVGNTTALFVRSGTPRSYATMQIRGTANGGRGYIYPKRAKVLVFQAKDGTTVFAKRVRGIKPNDYLTPAMHSVLSRL